MKKTILTALLAVFCLAGHAQTDFLLSEYLYKTPDQLKREGFKYRKKTNQYIRTTATPGRDAFILGLFGVTSDIPSGSTITIQGGDGGVAWVRMAFHDDGTYIALMNFINHHEIPYEEFDLGYATQIIYRIDDFEFSLRKSTQIGTTTAAGAISQQYYNSYVYVVHTIHRAFSPRDAYAQTREQHERRTVAVNSGVKKKSGSPSFEESGFVELSTSLLQGRTWQDTYSMGSAFPIVVNEGVTFLDDRQLRYWRTNQSYDTGTDVLYNYFFDGNVIHATYAHQADGETSDPFHHLRIGMLPDSSLLLNMPENNDYTVVLYGSEAGGE
ncbi:MAG: hypothetical protein LIO85_03075 [Rikenellaceae bacterium]|nr:hypothetical protein [Rikenellaceae bacterium]